jgi:tRNA threonylcarbamoyl adenosine modification protein YjeE
MIDAATTPPHDDGGDIALDLPDEAATRTLGAALAAVLHAGDPVLLSGPLGAGKSALARAVIRGLLDLPEAEVPSPSYTLVNVHAGPRGEIWHADLYRLSEAGEALELGLEEAFAMAVVLVEWPDRLGDAVPARRLSITLEVRGEEARRAVLRFSGTGWRAVRAVVAGLA